MRFLIDKQSKWDCACSCSHALPPASELDPRMAGDRAWNQGNVFHNSEFLVHSDAQNRVDEHMPIFIVQHSSSCAAFRALGNHLDKGYSVHCANRAGGPSTPRLSPRKPLLDETQREVDLGKPAPWVYKWTLPPMAPSWKTTPLCSGSNAAPNSPNSRNSRLPSGVICLGAVTPRLVFAVVANGSVQLHRDVST